MASVIKHSMVWGPKEKISLWVLDVFHDILKQS